MRVELTREFRFESAHWLPHVPPDHKCFRMHGHSYRVEVTLLGETDPVTGWLVDFGEVRARVEPVIRGELDHRVLNEVPGLENPTAEHLAGWLWRRLEQVVPHLHAITVHETTASRVTYRGPGPREAALRNPHLPDDPAE
jgi:6-pyruvoyltetrahydropterin/6-carboxytetrahydropterin synthase